MMKFSLLTLLSTMAVPFVQGQEIEDDDVRPSPPSIGADVPVTYFGPPPSTVQKELIGPFQLLTAGQLDEDAGTITLPLYMGRLSTTDDPEGPFDTSAYIWYILTDTTDLGIAQGLGLNHAPKLRFANVGRGARLASMGPDNILNFNGDSLVDFSPVRNVVPGAPPNYFPPTTAEPGQIGNPNYSPITYVQNMGEVFNAPVVADPYATTEDLNKYCDGVPNPDTCGEDDFQGECRNTGMCRNIYGANSAMDCNNARGGVCICGRGAVCGCEGAAEAQAEARTILHDRVIQICPEEQTVTLTLTPGHSFARPVLYLSSDAIDAGTAALEQATYAPGLEDISLGDDDSFLSSVERLFAVTNGPTNGDIPEGSSIVNHPQRNGLNSALRGDGPPLNVLGGIPTVATDYSPLWDVNVGEWTPEAVEAGFRGRWLEEFQILGFVERGAVTGPGGTPFGSSGNLVNCPIVHRFL